MKTIKILAFVFVVVFIASCQKVIHIDLNAAAPKYVIEGQITDSPMTPYWVDITQSVSFESDNTFPTISGAKVVMSDTTLHISDTLVEVTPGHYQGGILTRVYGHVYGLDITHNGNHFTSYSTMPQPVALDSVIIGKGTFRNPYSVIAGFIDPAVSGNFYRLQVIVNGVLENSIFITSDKLINGQARAITLRTDAELKQYDEVGVALSCIDSGTYVYLSTLRQSSNQNSGTPANPTSNINGGALGFFSAHTTSVKGTIIQ